MTAENWSGNDLEFRTITRLQNYAKKPRILIMDDDVALRRLLQRVLTKYGYEVVTSNDGVEMLDCYISARELGNPFDLVIMDLIIYNGMGGEEAIQRLKTYDTQAKAILSTATIFSKVVEKHLEFGFCGLIRKPYLLPNLLEIVEAVLFNNCNKV
jgi:two-component system, cell cycle sensor histidine kinase and response regulator CckA